MTEVTFTDISLQILAEEISRAFSFEPNCVDQVRSPAFSYQSLTCSFCNCEYFSYYAALALTIAQVVHDK